jgi:hypothetical protein
MPALPLRTDFDAKSCRLAARHSGDASQARRLLSIAAIYDGASRGEAAVLGSVTVQIVCDWVKKFNAHGPDGLINRKAPGKPCSSNSTGRPGVPASRRCMRKPVEVSTKRERTPSIAGAKEYARGIGVPHSIKQGAVPR